MNQTTIATSLRLRAGELVEVRSREEILATLDRNACLDDLPFMPEMFEFCGRRLRVYKRAHKTCDTIHYTGSRRMANAVHLEGVRCDGNAHGGCEAECLIFWKEAWLKRVSDGPSLSGGGVPPAAGAPAVRNVGSPGCIEGDVLANTRQIEGPPSDQPIYVCQATQLLKASSPLPWWDVRQYWEAYASGNFSLRWILGVLCYASYNAVMQRGGRLGIPRALMRFYDAAQKLRGQPRHPRTRGRIPAGGRTPAVSLNLRPGEMVRVKDFETILDTIDTGHRNRGMRWDAEMVPYCGGVFRVRKRVRQIIDERTGKMLRLKSEPVILEGVICQSKYSEGRFLCPRSIYSYWHEVWLERVAQDSPTVSKRDG